MQKDGEMALSKIYGVAYSSSNIDTAPHANAKSQPADSQPDCPSAILLVSLVFYSRCGSPSQINEYFILLQLSHAVFSRDNHDLNVIG
jgi:hypothetical protein